MLDAGAVGVIIPHVDTADEVRQIVKTCLYPPEGSRSVGLSRAQKYGLRFDDYVANSNKTVVIIPQIEHIDGVNNLESILSVDGIDGCIIGPYDLSGSLGIPGNFDDPKVKSALSKVEKTCKKIGVSLGMHVIPPNYKEVMKYATKGYNFLAISLDTLFLGTICREQLKKLKKEIK